MSNLSDLKVLALDCQATGANPARGHLIEMGWIQTSASFTDNPAKSGVQDYLIRLPADAAIPRAVQRITGISEESLKTAVSSKIAWDYLQKNAAEVAFANQETRCPVIVHFARYEKPFLRDLHRQNCNASSFPLQVICTHEIAIRLLPDLPRRGIRAIAGYYGHSMPEFKRSADHAVATALIWQKMVRLLNTTCSISKLGELIDWLAATKAPPRSNRSFPMAAGLRRQLPDQPGIYRMLRANGDLLYIGKAKSLKQRVNSYFRQKAPHAEHILEMLTQARKLDVTLTGSALQAAILESDEIKRHSPPYNIALRRQHRQLAFFTKDLARQATIAHKDYPVGPLPGAKTIEALAAFGWWLKDGMQIADDYNDCIGYSVLALPPECAPEIDCLKEGFKIFKQHHRSRLKNHAPLRFLTSLGARLWQERLEAAALAETAEGQESNMDRIDSQQAVSGQEPVWTPESVVGAIEGMLRHAAYLIRRARWFCMLSESTLAWTAPDKPAIKKTMLVFEKGNIFERAQIMTTAEIPTPPGFGKSFCARRGNIDLVTYDRLRVVTTELRRIIAEGRHVDLRLNPKVTLRRQQLEKALRWV
ncbi:MAG: GIY-YIG nuclease family protein [Deltaproteobacteria bacterium]|jgi:DNA polymerase-3 subunit epsilon|nr:GIY-YIG nuclease family protein [Deltaproteobacteria bacterium]